MKDKKTIKLVFKDTLDIENLFFINKYIKELIQNSECTCYHVFNSYEKEFETILINYLSKYASSVKVKKISYKPNYFIYLNNYFKRIIYFASNALISTSSLQKLLEYFFIPRRLILSKIAIKNYFIKQKQNIKIISFEELLLKDLQSIVIFFRSDSINNSTINLDKNDVTINVLRNLDTPFLKGTPTIKADYLFNIYYPIIQEKYLNAFKDHKCINFNLINQNYSKSIYFQNRKTNKINILYAMSHTAFAKNEIGLITKLREIIPENINLKVKLHGSNPVYFFKYLSKLDLVDKNLDFVDKPNFRPEDINKQYKFISKYDICMGLSTTFFLKGFLAGIKNNLFISDERFFPYTALYSREHIKILFKYINCKEVKNIYDLPKIIKKYTQNSF